jgi:hypothetical protein
LYRYALGSEIHIMAGVALSQRDTLLFESGLDLDALNNIELVHHVGRDCCITPRPVCQRISGWVINWCFDCKTLNPKP